jgi:YidC/Oxa1 family membrane protein insertase
VAFTMAIRLLLIPFSYHALRGQAGMAAFQARVQELRKRYAHQPDRMQRELNELYRAEGSGLLAGCLPLVIQLPFFSIMYRLFLSRTIAGRPNGLLSRDLLSTPLGSHWLSGAGPASPQGLLFLGLFALLGVVAFVSARASRAASPPVAGQPAAVGALARLLPYSTLIIAAIVPLAAGIYLLTTSSWSVAERAALSRFGRRSGTPPVRHTGRGSARSGTSRAAG